jgi:hypothetical protein
MATSPVRKPMSGRDNTLRHYIDRHSGFVVGVSLAYAFASCFGLVLLFGLYAAIGGENNLVISIGLCLWLAFNGWAIRRFLATLRRRAAAENERLRYANFKPLQTN